MSRTVRPARAVIAMGAFALAFAAGAQAQDRVITGVVTGSQGSLIPLAIAPAAPGDGAAASLLQVIRDDLDFSGYFALVPAERAALVAPPGTTPDSRKAWLESWRSVGADVVLDGQATQEGGQMRLEAALFDTGTAERILWNRYAGEPSAPRRISHKISDDVVRQLTGQMGIASTRIACVVKTGPDAKEILLVDYDGERPRRLTATGKLTLSPAWAPAADRLSFISFRGRSPGIDIVNTEGRISRLPTAGGDLNSAPDWSPDGKRMAYSSNRDGNSEIYRMEIASGAETRLTAHPGIDSSPCWSPNGREIAFTSNRAGSPQIYIMDADGLSVRRLTTEGNYNESAAWSPRGDRIAYVSRIEGRFEIHVIELQSGAITRLTKGSGNSENPRWSPDGRHLVFASDRTGLWTIYTMAADGSQVRAVTSREPAFTPDWSR